MKMRKENFGGIGIGHGTAPNALVETNCTPTLQDVRDADT